MCQVEEPMLTWRARLSTCFVWRSAEKPTPAIKMLLVLSATDPSVQLRFRVVELSL